VGKVRLSPQWIVLPIWFALFLILGALGTQLKEPMSDDFSMPNCRRSARPASSTNTSRHVRSLQIRCRHRHVCDRRAARQKLTEPANHQAVQALIGQLDQLGIVDHSKPIADPITATQDLGCLTGSPDPAKCSGAPLNVLNKTEPDSVAYFSVPFTIEDFSKITDNDRKAAYDVADPRAMPD